MRLDIRAPSLQAITLSFQGDLGSGELLTAFDPLKKTISLKEAGHLTLHLPTIPAPVHITLEPTQLNLQSQTGIVKGVAETAPFNFHTAPLDETTTHFTADLKTQQVEFFFRSAVSGSPLTLEGSYNPSKLQIKGRGEKLPTPFIQSFLVKGPNLSPLLGAYLTTSFQASIAGEAASFQIKAKSPTLSLDAMLKKEKEQFELVEP